MKNAVKSTLNAAQETGLRHYASLGLGTAVLAGAVTTMDASVAYTNYNNLLLTDTNLTDTAATSYGYDVNGDGTQDFRLQTRNVTATGATGNYAIVVAGVNGTSLKPINVVGTLIQGAQATYGYPSRLGAGVSVGLNQPFVTLSLSASGYYLVAGSFAFGAGFTNSKWKTAGANSGFLGFSFTAADGLHYGFAQLSIAPQSTTSSARSITLSGIGYQTTPNTAITTFAAPVPEPSSIALVALGGAGLVAYRRRRAAARASAEV